VATATSTKPPLKAIAHPANPLALWHLLSLDAPTVAVLWTWFIASANHVRLPLASALAMAITVWMLYAADRLMDTRLMNTRLMDARLMDTRLMDAHLLDANPTHHEDLEARHYFHHHHRTAFLTGILLASIALAILLPSLDAEAIHLYLILGGLVAGYFILIHATSSAAGQQKVAHRPPAHRLPAHRLPAHRLPKEIAVGLCFAAAIFIPTVARRPDLRLPLLPSALLFATLCSLNCLFIYAWEHDNPRTHRPAHAITRIALRNLSILTILLTLSSLALALIDHQAPWPIPCATAISAALLLLLHNQRHVISRTNLRAAADLALITPLLFLPFLHH
jgi:hypothetical protein